VCSTWYGTPIALSGVQLLLPQPEFDYFAAAAGAASSFVVEIQGELNLPGLVLSNEDVFHAYVSACIVWL
jgi:hypothetical protein